MANEQTKNEDKTIDEQVDEKIAGQKLEEKAKKEKRKKSRRIAFRVTLAIIVIFLINIYIILSIFYRGENFTVTLDSEYGRESGLVIYEDKEHKYTRTFLRSKDIDFFTDISVNWLPEDIDNGGDGSHNGKNYIAYTFYAENMGQDTINYWTTIKIDDVIKNVDEAIRVMVFKNGNKVIYAKNNKETGEPEPNTQPFKNDDTVMLELSENFKVGDEVKADVFEAGEKIDVQGTSKGKGFQGVIKRHGQHRGPMGHGSMYHRRPGSMGSTSTPGRVFKGKKLPGHMGRVTITIQNLDVVRVDMDKNVILLKGSVPGAKGSILKIKSAVKATK